ncbi:sigma-54 dependent transcriptional regulator [bacterium]|nr:sigma-54 dependent transcriptional regulator [bacterium]
MSKILIIDDDVKFTVLLRLCIERLGHEVESALTLREGLKAAQTGRFDIVYLDVKLPDGNGLAFIPEIHQTQSCPEVVIITGDGSECGAELAIRSGAWDYIVKTSTNDAKILPLVRALQYREQKINANRKIVLDMQGLIGSSPQIKVCFDLLADASTTDVPVLITGETGTGKERFARVIHSNSTRAGGNFVVVDCAALPETLVASLLFGHRKGAFTGADQDREGLIRQANGGTLFLDEVGEMHLDLQKSFLRVIQERRFRPLGSGQEVSSDFRLIAATNRNLESEVEQGQFRRDLYYRLKTLNIEIPPLRNRPKDIKELMLGYVSKTCEKMKIEMKGISPEFLEAMIHYEWPGNVRELINAVEKAVVSAHGECVLHRVHLPMEIRLKSVKESLSGLGSLKENNSALIVFSEQLPEWVEFHKKARNDAELKYLQDLIRLSGGRVKDACRISGLSQSHLYSVLNQHGLKL